MPDTTKPINSDWILMVLIVGWIIFSIVHQKFEVMIFLTISLMVLMVIGESE